MENSTLVVVATVVVVAAIHMDIVAVEVPAVVEDAKKALYQILKEIIVVFKFLMGQINFCSIFYILYHIKFKSYD